MADENEIKEEKESEITSLSNGLKKAIEERLKEVTSLMEQVGETEKAELEKLRKLEEEKKKAENELMQRTPEFTLTSLHKVLRNPDIIRYMEEVGDILVYSNDRGFGNNMIFFTKNERKNIKTEVEELYRQREEIENSNLIPIEKENDLKEIDDKIEIVKKELDRLEKEGGIIYLYLQNKDTYIRLDLYSKDERIRDQSTTLVKGYFGKNDRLSDCFNEFNTPERIIEQIEKNMKDDKYCFRLNELRKKLKEAKV